MGKIEDLASLYEQHISLPWQKTMGGAQRVIMVVYDKELEKVFRAKKREFEHRTNNSKHKWNELDCTKLFALWASEDEYIDDYFEYPDDMTTKIESEFAEYVIERLKSLLNDSDENTVVALTGVACLYGFLRISELIHAVERDINGRLVVFFPGSKEDYNFKLLDARDGWNYLAHTITLKGTGGA